MIRNEDIELVKSQVNMRMLAEHFGIHVNRTGQALCPFHSDKQPSMKVHAGFLDHDGYYCWACGAGGDIINFVREYCSLDFEGAVRYIAAAFCIRIMDEKEISPADIERIHQGRNERNLEEKISDLQRRALAVLAEKIRFYERLKNGVEPFSDLFCYLSNQIPVLTGEWEELYEIIGRSCRQ